jgi:hypothetical protein
MPGFISDSPLARGFDQHRRRRRSPRRMTPSSGCISRRTTPSSSRKTPARRLRRRRYQREVQWRVWAARSAGPGGQTSAPFGTDDVPPHRAFRAGVA